MGWTSTSPEARIRTESMCDFFRGVVLPDADCFRRAPQEMVKVRTKRNRM